jgi:hypothetical protein
VVGPIARELLSGNTALSALVQAHLATEDDLLRPQGAIAWRATLALLGGVALGAETGLLAHEYALDPTTRAVVGKLFALAAYLPGFRGLAWRLTVQMVG